MWTSSICIPVKKKKVLSPKTAPILHINKNWTLRYLKVCHRLQSWFRQASYLGSLLWTGSCICYGTSGVQTCMSGNKDNVKLRGKPAVEPYWQENISVLCVSKEGLHWIASPNSDSRVACNLSLVTVRTLLVEKWCTLKLHNEDRDAHPFLSTLVSYNLVIVKMKYEPITTKAF